MVRTGEYEHSKKISAKAEQIWGWVSPVGKVRMQRRLELLIKYGGLKPNIDVLELGCGTGIFTEGLINTGINLVSIDISDDFIEKAKKKFREKNNVKLLVMDAEELKFPLQSFDVVLGVSVLHHLDLRKSLLEIYRVLKKGGRVIFSEPNMLNPQILLQKNIKFLKEKLGDSPNETAFFRWGLKCWLKAAGFKNIKIIPFDFLHPLIPLYFINSFKNVFLLLEKIPLIREFAGSLLIYAEK